MYSPLWRHVRHDAADWRSVGDALGPYIDRVAGSPWMGAEYCRRMYAGDGALFRGYWHMHVDEEAQAVAQMLGVFWQRRDLSHLHRHWTREGVAEPQYLSRANRGFSKSARLFKRRKAMRFPGHEPLG